MTSQKNNGLLLLLSPSLISINMTSLFMIAELANLCYWLFYDTCYGRVGILNYYIQLNAC